MFKPSFEQMLPEGSSVEAIDINAVFKPCPFCGGQVSAYTIPPHRHHFVEMPDYGGGAFAECTECSAAMSTPTAEELIEAWNRRVE